MHYDKLILLSLLKQFWLESENGKFPIEHMAYQLMEVAKWHSKTRMEIYDYLQLLISADCVEEISENPLLYQFTDKGKTIRSMYDIENIIDNTSSQK